LGEECSSVASQITEVPNVNQFYYF
jgi:hypothetical protein